MAERNTVHPGRYLQPRDALLRFPPTPSDIARLRKDSTLRILSQVLDRSDVLEGHTGCVNALSWACNGRFLLSGGDDTTVRLWEVDSTQLERNYPLTCSTIIETGHRSNIFNVKMLPFSSRVVTAARDSQIRVFDLNSTLASATQRSPQVYTSRQLQIATMRCHEDAVKIIVTENSPDLFLSVSEDGTVRQHDLRTPHNCLSQSCSALINAGFPLLSMSVSSLTPHLIVAAGEAPHGYLFDRRYSRRIIEDTWGMVPKAGESLTTCVRKFGRRESPRVRRSDHITSARTSHIIGHEVILSFSNDAVYSYSVNDDAEVNDSLSKSQSSEESSKESDASMKSEQSTNVPAIMPRRRFVGARNVATIKDVNYLGPNDDYVVSGSDDGNFFIWTKGNGNLYGIYEGDSSVVNVVEGHPYLPVIAVSGIDHTIKIFSPAPSSKFSRMTHASQIIESNQRPRSPSTFTLSSLAALQLLARARNATGNEAEVTPVECVHQ